MGNKNMNNTIPEALKLLAEMQKVRGSTMFRVIEDIELDRMNKDPTYKSPFAFLKDSKFQNIIKKIPKTQSIIHYQILEEKKNVFENIINTHFSNREKYHVTNNVYFGTICSRIFNANVSYLPKQNEYLIILNETLWEGMRYISDVIAAPITQKSNSYGLDINYDVAQKNISRFGEIINKIINIESLYDIELESSANKNDSWNFFWNSLHSSMESFAFGHEYGHFVRRHFHNDDNSVANKWSNEYDADRVALDLIVKEQVELNQKSKGPFKVIFVLLGCYLFYKFLLLIEEFMFTIVSPEDTHPPTIIRYANFKRVCYEQMGEDGLSVLDTYISSIDELVDYYINQSSSVLLICQQVSLLNRVTRTFQKATLWAIMRKRKIEIIDYLNVLLRKMSKLSIQKKDSNIDFLFPNEITRKLSCYLIVTEVITLETTSDLLQIVIENNLLSKEDVFAIINNCIKILEIDISSRELIHS